MGLFEGDDGWPRTSKGFFDDMSKELKRPELKFGIPHLQQCQERDVFAKASNTWGLIPRHLT